VRDAARRAERAPVRRATGALATRYAKALLEVAEARAAAAALELRDELRGFVAALEGHEPLRRALAHPSLASESKRKIVQALAERAQATPLVRRLVDVLAIRDRLSLLGEVSTAYARLANAAHGVVMAEVVSAAPLLPAQRQALVAAVSGVAGAVELRSEVDPLLVGGLVLTVAGRTYDGSVSARLGALRRRLAAAS
jgi:F-type H+-transporting ATPase subunit delta